MLMVSKVEEKMLESIPERWQSVMHRMEEINHELRSTDIRLLHNPTDEQIQHFCSIILEGNRLCNEIDVKDICGTTSATSARSAGRRVYRRRMYGVHSSSGSPRKRTSSTAGSRCSPD